MIQVLKAKIHGAYVTQANLDYEGSITIDKKLLDATGIVPYERVQVLNCNNGERIETYVIEGSNGQICLNGAAARLFYTGDKVIIISYRFVNDDQSLSGVFTPVIVFPNSYNLLD